MKGGYQPINTPTNKEKQTTTDKEIDWRYRISNDKLREITNTLPIRATGGCKSNPTRSAPRPDMCPAGNTMMMMISY